MVRVGLVGVGFMGRTHFDAYANIPNTQVTALADIDPHRAKGDMSTVWGNLPTGGTSQLPMDGVASTTDYKELVAMDDVDVIDICVQTPGHKDVALAATKAGKHVVCEKPLARTSSDARQIATAANQSEGYFMPAMCIRFWPGWSWAKEVLDNGRFGKVLAANFRRVSDPPPGWYQDGALSGGAALDLHLHDTDFVQYLFGVPNGVSSHGYVKHTGEVDHLVTTYLYDDVPLVVAEGGWAMSGGFGFTMRYTINFENATIDYNLDRGDEALVIHQGGNTEVITIESKSGQEVELAYFADCIEKGEPPSVVTVDDAVAAIRIVEAEVQSVRTGAPVTM
ncbi:MAG: oxidoreductase [Phycisphaerae bacterium]|nr:oxidoreductase [Phycisphaerae bacterium]